MQTLLLADVQFADAVFCVPAAGTISGEEFPIVSKTNIKEYRDSFSYETFSFLANPNITFHVYVSNFSWPIKIQVRSTAWFMLPQPGVRLMMFSPKQPILIY